MEPISQLKLDRVYDAPVDAVWSAWTDPNKLQQWWGPENVSIPECELDLRAGGRFYIVMEAGAAMGPYKGTRWPMEALFSTVQTNAKLVYNAIAWTEGQKDDTQLDQTTEIIFTDQGATTRVQIIATITKVGPKAGMAVQGMPYGFNQQLDKLARFLA
jgi:uncharacterized protein YndB with AHSA1/START domain